MKSKFVLLTSMVIVLAAFVLSTSPAYADPITIDGIVWTLSYSGDFLSEDLITGTQTFQIFLKAETAGWTGSATDHITAVGLKVAAPTHLVGGDLFNVLFDGVPDSHKGDWSFLVESGVNNSAGTGCTGPSNGFLCTEFEGGNIGVHLDGTIYTWIFDIEVAAGQLKTDAGIKVRFEDDGGVFIRQLSEPITLQVPEPSTLILLLSSAALFIGAATFVKKS